MVFLKVIRTATDDILQLLKRNIIGTPNKGMLYQHLEVSKKINSTKNPYYVNLFHHKKLIGTCTFCSRATWNVYKSIPSFYIRYFTFSDKYRTTENRRKSTKPKNTIIRKELEEILQGNELVQTPNSTFFHYAYVDPRNIRSARLCTEFGFEPVRQFSTIIFHRMNPKDNFSVQECKTDEEVENIKKLVKLFYKDYTMFSMENLFVMGGYYVIKDSSNTILAGVQANADHWKILELPGKMGKVILSVFSFLPYLNKIINKDYKFLTIEGVYYKNGNEKYLSILIEALLARYKLNSAMVWADVDSELYQKLKSFDLGIVSKINHEVKANVICRFIGFKTVEVELFKQNPAYISGIDLT